MSTLSANIFAASVIPGLSAHFGNSFNQTSAVPSTFILTLRNYQATNLALHESLGDLDDVALLSLWLAKWGSEEEVLDNHWIDEPDEAVLKSLTTYLVGKRLLDIEHDFARSSMRLRPSARGKELLYGKD